MAIIALLEPSLLGPITYWWAASGAGDPTGGCMSSVTGFTFRRQVVVGRPAGGLLAPSHRQLPRWRSSLRRAADSEAALSAARRVATR